VAIAIFGLISTAVIVNLRGSSPSREVQQQANNISSLLRQAQVMSFAGEPLNGTVPTGGYGVDFNVCTTPPCSVTMFGDLDNSFSYDPATETFNQVSLGPNVTIESISEGAPMSVIFKPPRPYTCFNGVCSGIGELVITLGSTEVTRTIDVTVNQISGQISS